MKKLTIEEFIERAKEIHGEKYNYSKVEYINSSTKVCIICPIHGEFYQKPYKHLKGQGCIKCRNQKQRKTTKEFIMQAKEIHGDKYDYSKVEYVNAKTKVCIICPIHGEFWQTPDAHLNKQGCPNCSNIRLSTDEFIRQSKKIHNNKYDYSKVEYTNANTKVCIICPKHGEFWQTPDAHLNGKGCKKCSIDYISDLKRKDLNVFIMQVKEIHGNKYDYSKVEYNNCSTKVCIICPKHGEFWQTPQMHLQGQGCPKCKSSKLEIKIETFLKNNGFKFEEQKRFKWLGKQSLDFYLPKYNVAIECQGEQHFKPIELYGGEEGYKKTIYRDEIKLEKCRTQKINLLYYSDLEINYPYKVITDLNNLKEEIIKENG